jgi:hypothetical protein
VPHLAVNAERFARCSAAQLLAALIVACSWVCVVAFAFAETHLPKAFDVTRSGPTTRHV